MSNTRTLELDISKEGTGTCVKVGQGDDGGTTIKALIYDNGNGTVGWTNSWRSINFINGLCTTCSFD